MHPPGIPRHRLSWFPVRPSQSVRVVRQTVRQPANDRRGSPAGAEVGSPYAGLMDSSSTSNTSTEPGVIFGPIALSP